MKKIFLACLMIYCVDLTAQPAGNVNSTGSATCDSVNTLYAYTYLNHGAMFNVIADTSITLDHLTANINNGTAKYYIYYRTGSFIGFEANPSAWSIIDSAIVTSVNNGSTISNQPTVIPININLPMITGDTIALYFTSPAVSKVFLTSTTIPWGTVYSSNSSLSVSVARSVYQLFGTPFSTPQIWNGTVAYCTAGSVGIEDVSENDAFSFKTYMSGNDLQVSIDENIFSSNSRLDIQLTDVHFKEVASKSINSSITSINTAALSKGIYFCTLRSDAKVLCVKKVFLQ